MGQARSMEPPIFERAYRLRRSPNHRHRPFLVPAWRLPSAYSTEGPLDTTSVRARYVPAKIAGTAALLDNRVCSSLPLSAGYQSRGILPILTPLCFELGLRWVSFFSCLARHRPGSYGTPA